MTTILATLATVLGLAVAVLIVLLGMALRNGRRGWDLAELRAIAVRTVKAEMRELQAQLESYHVHDEEIEQFLNENGGLR